MPSSLRRMGFFGRSREGGGWGDLFAGLFGSAILVVGVAALAWFYFIWPMMDAFRWVGDSPPSRGPGYYDAPDPTPDLSDEYPNRQDDYDQRPTWVCLYEPTINYDWHDDVLCTDGVRRERPYLLPNESFVTDDELMREVAKYEDYLNS